MQSANRLILYFNGRITPTNVLELIHANASIIGTYRVHVFYRLHTLYELMIYSQSSGAFSQ